MSAYVVDKEHIDALVTAGVAWGENGSMSWYHQGERHKLRSDTASEVGRTLWAENARSVMARYPDVADGGEWPGPCDFSAESVMAYEFDWLPGSPDPLVVLKALGCYEYQSCEHGDEWDASEAKAFCDVLRHWAIDALPGMREAAGWSIASRDVFRPSLRTV